MVNTVIGIKSTMMDRAGQEDRAMEEYSEELCGILTKIEGNCSEPLLTAGRSQRSQQKQLSKLHKR